MLAVAEFQNMSQYKRDCPLHGPMYVINVNNDKERCSQTGHN